MSCLCEHEIIESTLANERQSLQPVPLGGRHPRQLFNWVTAGLLAVWIGLFGIVAANAEKDTSAVSTAEFIQGMLD